MLKYIFFVLFFGFLLHHIAVRISLPIYDFLQVIIVLIQVYNWEIRHWLIGLSLWTCWYFILMRDSLPIWLKGSQLQGYWITFTFKVARYSFSRPIPPTFEHKLRRHKQSFGKIAPTVVLDKDENLLWSGLQWHRSCHSNEMTLLPILLTEVFLGTENCSSKIIHGSFFLQ